MENSLEILKANHEQTEAELREWEKKVVKVPPMQRRNSVISTQYQIVFWKRRVAYLKLRWKELNDMKAHIASKTISSTYFEDTLEPIEERIYRLEKRLIKQLG